MYLPIRFGWLTNSFSRMPARSLRSNRRSRTTRVALVMATAATGQPLPTHRTRTSEPRGARTESTRTRAARGSTVPAMRMTGNGLMSLGRGESEREGGGITGGAATVTRLRTVLTAPSESVTRSPTS